MNFNYFTLFVITITLVTQSQCSKILGFFITPSQPHFVVHDSLMRGLAAKGHEVTVVSIYPPPTVPIDNYNYIHVDLGDDSEERDLERIKTSIFRNSGDSTDDLLFVKLPKIFKSLMKISVDVLKHPTIEKLKNDGEFDLAIFGWFFNDYQLGLAAHFKCPSVLLSPIQPIKIIRDYVANPSVISYTPSPFSAFPGNMSFPQRIINFGLAIGEHLATNAYEYFISEPIYQELFPQNAGYPTYSDAKRNVSLVLLNHHFSQTVPAANFPGMIEIGGFNIHIDGQPLPKNYQDFLDSAMDGAILFSLGAKIQTSDEKYLPTDKLKILLKYFGKLKQKIIMKWELDELPDDLPENVMTGKWLPQSGILSHPNVKLFISNCGKNSVNEAKFHGVPILGVPIYGDHHINLKIIMDEGWAVPMSLSFMSEDSLKFAFDQTLINPKFRENIGETSKIYKDRLRSARETAIYWIEYVIRHRGASHLQSHGIQLNWFQLHSLDVIGFILIVLYLVYKIIKLVFSVISWLMCCCCRRRQNHANKKTPIENVEKIQQDNQIKKVKTVKGKSKNE